ncbi:MAG TPA: hypothetical protein PKZ53_11360, partial [Acidobacteriota bacterium]|nr:hypothetical protein [Acidobacteriota bacterium]
ESALGHLPGLAPAPSGTNANSFGYSVHARILPYIEQENLGRTFDINTTPLFTGTFPVSLTLNPAIAATAATPVKTFLCPADGQSPLYTVITGGGTHAGTNYVVNLGSDGVTRSLIYPDPGKPARVLPDEPMTIGPLRIDPPAGTDKLTVLFSKTRIASFEDPTKDLNKAFLEELSSRTYTTIEEEEIYLPSKEILAMYFANKGDLLKAEIDVRHFE